MWYYTEPSPRALALDAYLAQPWLETSRVMCRTYTEWIACVGLPPSDQPADSLELAVFLYWPYAGQAFDVVVSYTPPLENIERVLVANLSVYAGGESVMQDALPYMRAIARARRHAMFAALLSHMAPYLDDSPGVAHTFALNLIADSSADALRALIATTNVDIQRCVRIFVIREQESSAAVNGSLGLLRCRLEFGSAHDAARAADALTSVGFGVVVGAEEKPSIAGAADATGPGPCAAVVREALARRNERPS